ncbi:hypothetical protein PAXRUDRAFT_30245 [Paxillus rubicundulus Ve08.2h10]|uniref:Uncharacterized protein n=1 Tax=Paxillus rubicundulus Ve08.2h10 TaxID=930991 RepID=A0A0D0E5F1_9AGAM|nr:hypothetical protein PAXRUDRAFT_30245 [Paxillus rubicundulus Ve08.2h10]
MCEMQLLNIAMSGQDITGFLSVIFVGPGNFDPKQLGSVFHLYVNIPFDMSILNLYPDNDILPSLFECMVENNELDEKQVFEKKTAGFEGHLASILHDESLPLSGMGQSDDSKSVTFLKKMGVSDPESPDLLVHHGSQPINKYNNPDLLPGVSPSLFPFSIGGF